MNAFDEILFYDFYFCLLVAFSRLAGLSDAIAVHCSSLATAANRAATHR